MIRRVIVYAYIMRLFRPEVSPKPFHERAFLLWIADVSSLCGQVSCRLLTLSSITADDIVERIAARYAFTQREAEILAKIIRTGVGNDALSVQLGISPRTVANYIARMLDKTGSHSIRRLLSIVCRAPLLMVWSEEQLADAAMELLAANPELTAREREVLALLCMCGLQNRELSEKLYISEKTVKIHIGSIMRKTASGTTRELFAWMFRLAAISLARK